MSASDFSLLDCMDRFSTEEAATRWLERVVWPEGRFCGHCGGTRTREAPNARPMPYWCPDCRRYFSVRTGTVFALSKVPLRNRAQLRNLGEKRIRARSEQVGIAVNLRSNPRQVLRESPSSAQESAADLPEAPRPVE